MKKLAGLMAGCVLFSAVSMPVYAYTEEEKAYAKSMLQAYGYSPDWAGANQAYQDYMSGMYNDICEQYGLPKQNVQEEPGKEPGDGTEKEPAAEGGEDSQRGEERSLKEEESRKETEADDGRFHFDQIRRADGVGTAELLDILVEKTVAAPIKLEEAQGAQASQGMVYVDLVFQATNEGSAPVEAKEFLALSVNDGQRDYTAERIFLENAAGTGFLEETVLKPGENQVVHYVAEVPEDGQSFVGTAVFGGTSFEIYFDRDTHPKNRRKLGRGKAVQSSGFGLITVGKAVLSEQENERLLAQVPVTLENLREETIEPEKMGGILAAVESGVIRGKLAVENGQELGSYESVKGVFQVELSKEQWKNGGRFFVYFGGNWYQIETENS